MSFTDDLGVLNTGVDELFAVAAAHSRAASPLGTVPVIPIDPFEAEATPRGSKLMVSATASQFDTPPAKGDTLTIDATAYTIFDINADQGGRLTIGLEK